MFEKRREADSVVGDVWLFANYNDIILSSLRVLLDELLTKNKQE